MDFSRVQMYWQIGRRIQEEEQQGNALRSQFNWTQYRLLNAISDDYKREYYELEAMNNCRTARELERLINSQLYERLLLSNDKESVLAVARKERIPQAPQEIIKDHRKNYVSK